MSNHPVVEVSWYGAMAFCNYYGCRLPTEWQWQAVADFDGSYIYGCGTDIDGTRANYAWDNPAGLPDEPFTTPVGYYPSFGYGLYDIAGNVWEWTRNCYYPGCDPEYRVLCGGSWGYGTSGCRVANRDCLYGPHYRTYRFGFRAALEWSCPSAELTGDCVVDFKDFALMADQWLTSAP
jgi:formylglycine-generating enzyme required for sulfatase activity